MPETQSLLRKTISDSIPLDAWKRIRRHAARQRQSMAYLISLEGWRTLDARLRTEESSANGND